MAAANYQKWNAAIYFPSLTHSIAFHSFHSQIHTSNIILTNGCFSTLYLRFLYASNGLQLHRSVVVWTVQPFPCWRCSIHWILLVSLVCWTGWMDSHTTRSTQHVSLTPLFFGWIPTHTIVCRKGWVVSQNPSMEELHQHTRDKDVWYVCVT